jgi:hypothetical protein
VSNKLNKTSPFDSWVNATPTPKVVGTQQKIVNPKRNSNDKNVHDKKTNPINVVKKLIQKNTKNK